MTVRTLEGATDGRECYVGSSRHRISPGRTVAELETRLALDQYRERKHMLESQSKKNGQALKNADAPLEFRPAPYLPFFGWQPERNDFPVSLVDPVGVFHRRHQESLQETGELEFLAHVEVLSEAGSRRRMIPRVVAGIVLILGLAAAIAVIRTGSENTPEEAAIQASPTATLTPTSEVMETVAPGEDNLRRALPGLGGALPLPTATANPTVAVPSVSNDPTETVDEATVAATATPSPTLTPAIYDEKDVITVSTRAGDTLIELANKFNVSVRSLVWSNDIGDPSADLDAEMSIRVPGVDGVVHEVVAGDTVDSIALQYGVEVEAITGYAGNAIDPNLGLRPGTLLVVPGGTVADRGEISEYTVRQGDNLNLIAGYYGLEPQTLVWANELPRPELIHPGQMLIIPPGNGALVTAEKGDTVEALASQFDVDADVVRNYGFNGLGGGAVLQIGQQILVPGDFLPDIDTSGELNADTVAGPDVQRPATGNFLWPTEGTISQEFSSEHNGLDIANDEWTPVNAADGGVVIFAGWSDLGLGYAVGIDHGNGYQTWYGHMSTQPYVEVGQVIWQGGYLGPMGSTGKSTGPHLHFIVMKDGVYQNPLDYLN